LASLHSHVTGTDLQGLTFLVTGANSGIGRAIIEALAGRGGRVVLAARSETRTRPVLDSVRSRYPGADAQFMLVDLSDLSLVRRSAEAFLASGRPLDVLVNNAAIAGSCALSRQGFDLTYAVNYIGPFLLTSLLLPRLQQSPTARIVNVSSNAHFRVKQMDWSVLERRATPKLSALADYAATKLMNVLHARELARRLAGTSVTTFACHPGLVASNIWRAVPQPVRWFIKLFMLSNEQGAATPLYCATAAAVRGTSGRYYDQCRELPPNRLATDDRLVEELWTRTEHALAATGG
jgi:dehydrogenase/reductase SDR family protein 13